MGSAPWIVGLGGGAAALYFWSRNHAPAKASSSTPPPARPTPAKLNGRWVWPVPQWQGRAPVISDGFNSPRPGFPRHGAVDIMFSRLASDSARAAGTPNGSKAFVMPNDLSALAASDGVIWSAMKTPRGYAIVIDHGKRGGMPVATFYTHLESMLVKPTGPGETKQQVRAGQPLGTIGFDPLDPNLLKHLHFEVWLGGPNDKIDPTFLMRSWEIKPATAATLLARNASLLYRPIGARGEAYPQWIRDLRGQSGVYLIRDAASHELLYIGSSHRRLYETVTRHFQVWRRYKSYWSAEYAQGQHDPGVTYDRASVEVAIRITPHDDSLDEEAHLICRMKPRDNLLGQCSDETEEVPF